MVKFFLFLVNCVSMDYDKIFRLRGINLTCFTIVLTVSRRLLLNTECTRTNLLGINLFWGFEVASERSTTLVKFVGTLLTFFTFMLPCIAIDFFLNNQQDALIIQILFCYKTLHVSGIFCAHHQEFYTVHSALVSFMQVSDDPFKQSQDGTAYSSILTSGWLFKKKPTYSLYDARRNVSFRDAVDILVFFLNISCDCKCKVVFILTSLETDDCESATLAS
jgi:hypothetical protein